MIKIDNDLMTMTVKSGCMSVLTGAGRLELCSSLLEGGLTPSLGEQICMEL